MGTAAPALPPLFTASTLEDALLADLKARLPAWCEAYGVIPPRGWELLSGQARHAEVQTPSVLVVSPGTIDEATKLGGSYNANWRVDAMAVVAGKDDRHARELAQAYTALLRLVIVRAGSLGLPWVKGWTWLEETYDRLAVEDRRTLMGASTGWAVHLEGVLTPAGPRTPDEEYLHARTVCAQTVVPIRPPDVIPPVPAPAPSP